MCAPCAFGATTMMMMMEEEDGSAMMWGASGGGLSLLQHEGGIGEDQGGVWEAAVVEELIVER